MKKVFLFLVAVMLTLFSNAQIGMNSAGRVVVGAFNTNITEKFHVNGTSYFTGNAKHGAKVGIGEISPNHELNVEGRSYFRYKMEIGATTTSNVKFFADGNGYFTGTLGIGIVPDNITNGYSTLKVNGGDEPDDYAIRAYGNCISTGSWTPSDEKLKKEIKNIENPLETLKQVIGRTYYYKSPKELKESGLKSIASIPDTIRVKREKGDSIILVGKEIFSNFPREKQYGVLAQELEPILPELTRFDTTEGNYIVNYDGFIPILISAVNEQTVIIEKQEKRIDKLEEQIELLKNSISNNEFEMKDATLSKIENQVTTLYQNSPNPFTESTEIKYFLADKINKASIYIYNMNGTQLKNILLYKKGNGSIMLDGEEFNAGMYMYTLIADGKIIDTKTMILTD